MGDKLNFEFFEYKIIDSNVPLTLHMYEIDVDVDVDKLYR